MAETCAFCGVSAAVPQKPKYYTASFVLGILSICIPMHSIIFGLILGVIGLSMAHICKRKSAIILNIIGIIWAIFIFILLMLLTYVSYK